MIVPSQCYERTVRVETPGGHGSGFTIDRHGRQWLVTARHVVEGVETKDLTIVGRDGPASAALERLPPANPAADVAAFALDRPITANLELVASSEGAVFSQQAFFLGFPFGLSMEAGTIRYPMVKGALISGWTKTAADARLWLLDGINNPGFSGGPVVFNRLGTSAWHVCAVISGYRTERSVVIGDDLRHVMTNTGIILAYEIHHAIVDIDRTAGWSTS